MIRHFHRYLLTTEKESHLKSQLRTKCFLVGGLLCYFWGCDLHPFHSFSYQSDKNWAAFAHTSNPSPCCPGLPPCNWSSRQNTPSPVICTPPASAPSSLSLLLPSSYSCSCQSWASLPFFCPYSIPAPVPNAQVQIQCQATLPCLSPLSSSSPILSSSSSHLFWICPSWSRWHCFLCPLPVPAPLPCPACGHSSSSPPGPKNGYISGEGSPSAPGPNRWIFMGQQKHICVFSFVLLKNWRFSLKYSCVWVNTKLLVAYSKLAGQQYFRAKRS